ncbi:transcription elongation factor Spt5 [Sulfuracidifex tepidarius]|uniref:Transcription elongation factor Spt5 n=1 Tax=Sulfuracidifex tepidarius TaxID=1294262 RepID=A0A510E3J8_9CREN|nr:transcription elongation factor Spt5 [Sulfuracidifex tepidarius]BBG26660.1 Transcription elongation factor Spt5 [Sulfuracidifex tepidarius]
MERPKMRNYYAVKVTGGQEINVALMLEERIKTNNLSEIYSILVPHSLKGYIVIEAGGPHIVKLLINGIRNVKGLAQGLLNKNDVAKMISSNLVKVNLEKDQMVEINSGPFRGMQAQVVRVEEEKGEVVLNILESAFPLTVTVPIDQVKVLKR